jgi:translation initiation factor 3 subunit F
VRRYAEMELHQKVNPKEQIVGWYSTGDGVVPTDALIHEFYAHECVNPVHVTLDVTFTDRSKLMRAWVGQSLALGAKTDPFTAAGDKAAAAAAVASKKGDGEGEGGAKEGEEDGAAKPAAAAAAPPTAIHFQEIGLVNKFEEAERVGVGILSSPASDKLASEMEGLEHTVAKLSGMLEQSAAYVTGRGGTPGCQISGPYRVSSIEPFVECKITR